MSKIRLWSYQPASLYKTLQKQNLISGSRHNIHKALQADFDDEPQAFGGFINSYDWLAKQMKESGVKSLSTNAPELPFWAWFCEEGNTERPNLSRILDYGKDYLLLELEIELNRLFFTDYIDWHTVLNFGYHDKEGDNNAESFYQRLENLNIKPHEHDRYPPEFINELKESWKGIILQSNQLQEAIEKKLDVQATFFDLQLSDITAVYYPPNHKINYNNY